MLDLGRVVILEPGEEVVAVNEFVFDEEDILIVRQLLANVAMCPDAYDLYGRLSEAFGELSDEEIQRFTIGKDGLGETALVPSTREP